MAVQEDDGFDPELNKELKLTSHILQKGLQSGSTVGALLSIPVLGLRPSKTLSLANVGGWALVGGSIGLGLTAAVAARSVATLPAEGISDRVYRIHYNESQNRVDRFAAIGGALGAVVFAGALHKGGNSAQKMAAAGFCVGNCVGVMAHVASAGQSFTGMKGQIE